MVMKIYVEWLLKFKIFNFILHFIFSLIEIIKLHQIEKF